MKLLGNKDEVQFTMRMNAPLYEKLKENALKNRRSIRCELEHLTEKYMEAENENS